MILFFYGIIVRFPAHRSLRRTLRLV